MIRNVLFILLMIVSTTLIGQQNVTYEDFYKNRWKTPYNWAQKDTIILKLSPKDTSEKIKYGEYISFKEDKKVTYERVMFCPVGETFTTIENFLILDDKAYVYYKTKAWDSGHDKWKKKHKKYRILKHNSNTMVLKQI